MYMTLHVLSGCQSNQSETAHNQAGLNGAANQSRGSGQIIGLVSEMVFYKVHFYPLRCLSWNLENPEITDV